MDRGTRILVMGVLSIVSYLTTLYILSLTPVVATFSGHEGDTSTAVFTITKTYWDIRLTYFEDWSPFWSLKVEIYAEGETARPVFSTSVAKYTTPTGERVDLNSYPSLPLGKYYLKVYSKSVRWTIQVIEWG